MKQSKRVKKPKRVATSEREDALRRELDRIRALKLELLTVHPFWGHVLVQLELINAPELPTFAATDCVKRIWFNPRFTEQLTDRQLGFVLAHEVGHIVLLSAARQKGRDPGRWNRATDYAINRMVEGMKHPGRPGERLYDVPSGFIEGLGEIEILLDRLCKPLIAEAIYEILAEEDCKQTALTLDVGLGEIEVNDHGGGLDLHFPGERTLEALDELRELVGAAVKGWQADGSKGLAPGHLVRQLYRTPRSTVPWVEVLASFLEQASGLEQYNARRPHRLWLEEDIVVPTLCGAEPPPIVVALDTSGSMSEPVLSAVCGELKALADRAPRTTLIVADAKVQEVVPAAQLERYLVRGRLRGGGGTDHRPVFRHIARKLPKPALFVGLTDLYSHFPEEPPDYPVLWVVPPRHGSAPFGRVLVTGAER